MTDTCPRCGNKAKPTKADAWKPTGLSFRLIWCMNCKDFFMGGRDDRRLKKNPGA